MEPSSEPISSDQSPDDLVLELTDSLGGGVISDGRGPLTISRSGRIAVAEYADCRVTVLDVVSQQMVYRFGGCGGGPTEFRGVGDIAFVGDSLYVFDLGRRDLSVLSPTGELIRRFVAMAMVTDSVTGINFMSAVQDTLLSIANNRPGRDPSAGALLRANDGSLVRKFGNAQQAVRADGEIIAFLPQMCTVNRPEGALIIAANPYKSETTAYTTGGNVAWRATPRIDWLSPVPHDGKTWPSAIVRPPICNDQGVMLRTVNLVAWAPRDSSFRSGAIEIRTFEGRLIFASLIDSTQAELFSKGASWKDLWIFNDPSSALPQLRVFRLRQRTARNETEIRTAPDDTYTEVQ
jgi:hypothetical protein